nr:acyl-CoA--sterol O-acyltransferase 1-like isoform X1 [Ipomoea trifida]
MALHIPLSLLLLLCCKNGSHWPSQAAAFPPCNLSLFLPALMGLIIRIYDYSDSINPTVILIIYCSHIYLLIDIILAIVAALARAVLGLELEPTFNEPYLSTSLQDFWEVDGTSWPTWEVTWFFLLHGVCVAVEIAMKKALRGKCRLPGILGTILTLGFVMLTVCWLFLPQLLRCAALVRALAEYAALGTFVKDVGITLTLGAKNS